LVSSATCGRHSSIICMTKVYCCFVKLAILKIELSCSFSYFQLIQYPLCKRFPNICILFSGLVLYFTVELGLPVVVQRKNKLMLSLTVPILATFDLQKIMLYSSIRGSSSNPPYVTEKHRYIYEWSVSLNIYCDQSVVRFSRENSFKIQAIFKLLYVPLTCFPSLLYSFSFCLKSAVK
jgi:hypothetical protein